MRISIPVSATREARPRERGQWSLALERFREHHLAVAGVLALAALALASAFAPLLVPYDPERTQLASIFEPPALEHPFGTDSLGRDMVTRILYGGRISLSIGVLAMTVAISLGTVVGGIAGYYGGLLDAALMRFVDMMYSFPRLFVLILFSVLFGGSFLTIVLILGAFSWLTVSRLVRASFLSLSRREFVEAARAIGARDRRILVRHILPNAMAPIIVAATLGIANAIIAESTLSFLGLGIQPPTPSWGWLLKDAQPDLAVAWWTAFFPGLAIFFAVVSINFVGDGLRDALDPRHVTKRAQR